MADATTEPRVSDVLERLDRDNSALLAFGRDYSDTLLGAEVVIKQQRATIASQAEALAAKEAQVAEGCQIILRQRGELNAAEAALRAAREALGHAWEIIQSMAVDDLPEDHPDRELMKRIETAAATWPVLYGPLLAALSPTPTKEK